MNATAKDADRRSRQRLESALRDAGAELRGTTAKCPFHEDRTPSGSIHADEAGIWRFTCHTAACGFSGDVYDVIARHTGRKVDDVLREATAKAAPTRKPAADRQKRVFPTLDDVRRSVAYIGTVERIHAYTNPDTGRADMAVVRLRGEDGKKTFLPHHPVPGGFSVGAPPKPWPLYNRTRVRTVDEVVVVEGEKCVEALAAVGVVATTSPTGAGKAPEADWRPLAGKTAYLWPDNDDTGRRHMDDVAAILEKLSPPCRVYRVDTDPIGLPPKGDAADFLARLPVDDCPAEAVWEVVRTNAVGTGAAAELFDLIEQTISGQRKSIPWPWPKLSKFGKTLFPGTTTLLCGDPGSAKSFLALEAFWRWHEGGVRVALYEMEDPRPNHMLRVLAQMSRCADVADDAWAVENPDTLRRIRDQHEARIESFGRVVTSAPEKQPTMDDLAAWVEARCADGCQIIGIDPITYAATSDKPWEDDKRFIWRVKTVIERTGARLILVTHPKKGGGSAKGGMSMDDMAGGAAWPRHAQSVLWMVRKDQPEDVILAVGKNLPDVPCEVDRIIRINKTRHGKGAGLSIGYTFDPDSLTFREEGVIAKPAPKARRPALPKAPAVEPMVDPFREGHV